MLSNIGLFVIILHSFLFVNISEETPIMGLKVETIQEGEFKSDFAFVGSLGEYSKLGVHKKFENHYCAGVLISKRHVLTAAHCLDYEIFNSTMVTFGSTDLNRGLSYELKYWITYKSWAIYNGEPYSNILHYDDIGIITLSSDVHRIRPAAISKLTDPDIFGKKVIVMGWGIYNLKKTTRRRQLQKAYLRVLDSTGCGKKLLKLFGTLDVYHPNEYCTHSIPPVTLGCGDSGGPLLVDSTKELIGISTSFFDVKKPLINKNSVSVHIKVRLYKKFIDDVVNSPFEL